MKKIRLITNVLIILLFTTLCFVGLPSSVMADDEPEPEIKLIYLEANDGVSAYAVSSFGDSNIDMIYVSGDSYVSEIVIPEDMASGISYLYIDKNIPGINHEIIDNLTNLRVIMLDCKALSIGDILINYAEILTVLHNEVPDADVPPTCSEVGLTGGSHCSNCYTMIKAPVFVDKIEHTLVIEPEVPANCYVNGKTERISCSVCGLVIKESETIKKLNHEGVIITPEKPLSCTEGSNTALVRCKLCNSLLQSYLEYIPAGHHMEYIRKVDATCTEDGHLGGYKCIRCDYSEGLDIIPATGHNMVEIDGYESTCTGYGRETIFKCVTCKYEIGGELIPALGHTEVALPDVEVTCTSDGSRGGSKCSVCGEYVETPIIIPSAGHTIVEDPSVVPTLTTPGLTKGSHCEVCGEVIVEQIVIPAFGSNDETMEFVERLYNCVLNRPADANGKESWTNALKDGTQNGGDVAYGFFFSREVTEANISDEDFINRLYNTFLDRDADKDGYLTWTQYMADGHSRYEVFMGFVNSSEWSLLCDKYGILSGSTNNGANDVSAFATRLYTICLGRRPDPDGVNNWSSYLTNGIVTGTEAAHGFFFGEEFVAMNCSNKLFVERLYSTLMGRSADEDGLNMWMGLLDSGAWSREEVFNGFAGSAEFRMICLQYGINV